MAYIGYKVSIWRRVKVKDEVANDPKAHQDLIEMVKKCLNVESNLDVMVNYEDDEILLDTEELLYPSDNDNQSTVELYDDNGNVLASNEPIEIEIIKSPLEQLIDKWETEMGSYIPNAPIYAAFIEEAKEYLKKEKLNN